MNIFTGLPEQHQRIFDNHFHDGVRITASSAEFSFFSDPQYGTIAIDVGEVHYGGFYDEGCLRIIVGHGTTESDQGITLYYPFTDFGDETCHMDNIIGYPISGFIPFIPSGSDTSYPAVVMYLALDVADEYLRLL